jgi:uncharacterized Zn finger protein (UPF0148 family)
VAFKREMRRLRQAFDCKINALLLREARKKKRCPNCGSNKLRINWPYVGEVVCQKCTMKIVIYHEIDEEGTYYLIDVGKYSLVYRKDEHYLSCNPGNGKPFEIPYIFGYTEEKIDKIRLLM